MCDVEKEKSGTGRMDEFECESPVCISQRADPLGAIVDDITMLSGLHGPKVNNNITLFQSRMPTT